MADIDYTGSRALLGQPVDGDADLGVSIPFPADTITASPLADSTPLATSIGGGNIIDKGNTKDPDLVQGVAPQITGGLDNKTGLATGGAGQIAGQSVSAAERARTSALVGTEKYDSRDIGDIAGRGGPAEVKSGGAMIAKDPRATVSGQLDMLLNKDSAYMQNVNREAKAQAAASGLLGTSAAAGHAVRMAIQEGRPIAEADAKTYAQAVLAEQDTYNKISQNIADGVVTADLKNYQSTLDQAMANKNTQLNILADAAAQANDTVKQGFITQLSKELDFETQRAMGNLESKLKTMLQNQQITADAVMQTQNLNAQIVSGTLGKITEMMMDDSMVESFVAIPKGADPDKYKPTDKDYALARTKMNAFFRNLMSMGMNVGDYNAAVVGRLTDWEWNRSQVMDPAFWK